ncbi:hypothetical protein AWC20_23330 [Mycobacterium parmense]|nr:hypothetical protein AWC20_23330 [Mycobacterium parmense]
MCDLLIRGDQGCDAVADEGGVALSLGGSGRAQIRRSASNTVGDRIVVAYIEAICTRITDSLQHSFSTGP